MSKLWDSLFLVPNLMNWTLMCILLIPRERSSCNNSSIPYRLEMVKITISYILSMIKGLNINTSLAQFSPHKLYVALLRN